jgi:hypothetical protein
MHTIHCNCRDIRGCRAWPTGSHETTGHLWFLGAMPTFSAYLYRSPAYPHWESMSPTMCKHYEERQQPPAPVQSPKNPTFRSSVCVESACPTNFPFQAPPSRLPRLQGGRYRMIPQYPSGSVSRSGRNHGNSAQTTSDRTRTRDTNYQGTPTKNLLCLDAAARVCQILTP